MIKRKTLIIFTVGALVLIGASATIFVLYKIFVGPQKDVALASNFAIGTDTSTIPVEGIVITDRDKQFISIVLKDGFYPVIKQGIRTPTGEIIHVEVSLVAEDGTVYPLHFASAVYPAAWGTPVAEFDYQGAYTWPRGQRFARVELKSDIPFEVKRIYWSGYNWDQQK